MIFHVTPKSEWEAQVSHVTFKAASLEIEGFIHCCTAGQLTGVLQRYFSGQSNLILLSLDEDKLEADLKYEPGPDGELFPHIYGPINKSSVDSVEQLR